MTKNTKRIVLAFFVVAIAGIAIFFCAQNKDKASQNQPYLVVLSLDGFRWDYASSFSLPNLGQMAQEGVSADALIPSFPTKTFPNHYSMATGLYPDNHGIILNNFFNTSLNKQFVAGDPASVGDANFFGGEPIWATAEKQNLRTANYFWVGSEAPTGGVSPSIWKKYDHNMPFTARIDSVISWLQLPDSKRPHLIMWYMHEPDAIGHANGPRGEQTKKTVVYLDSLIGVFRAKLKELPIGEQVNFMVVSDHGMGEIAPERTLYLDELVPRYWLGRCNAESVIMNLSAIDAYKDSLYNRLQKVEHLKVWKKEEVPARLHYGKNPNLVDLVVVADSAWNILVTNDQNQLYSKGAHGYDNQNKDMHGIFYAVGPAFKKGYKQTAFENVNLYPLFAKILGVTPAKVDGTLEPVQGMLVEPEEVKK